MFCSRCLGVGEILGNGMMKISCVNCNGSGKLTDNSPQEINTNETIDIKSRAYKVAIKDIMKLHPGISRKEAAKMFRETFDKV